MQELVEKIKASFHVSSEAEQYLRSISKERTLPKASTLIRQGQTVNKIFYVSSGCLRSYCIDKNGKEHTLQFAIKDWWISDYIAIHTDELSTLTVECLTNSSIIEFDTKGLEGLLARFPEFEPFQRRKLELHLVSLQKRILNMLQLSALERYDLFREQYGDIERHTANYHIASFLGITQESLSRLRVNKAKG